MLFRGSRKSGVWQDACGQEGKFIWSLQPAISPDEGSKRGSGGLTAGTAQRLAGELPIPRLFPSGRLHPDFDRTLANQTWELCSHSCLLDEIECNGRSGAKHSITIPLRG